MLNRIKILLKEVEEYTPKTLEELENFRIRMLGKKGEITILFDDFKTIPPELKKELGQEINKLKNLAQDKIKSLFPELKKKGAKARKTDLSLPADPVNIGARHPDRKSTRLNSSHT